MAPTDTAIILANLQDQVDDLTAAAAAHQAQLERLLPLLEQRPPRGT